MTNERQSHGLTLEAAVFMTFMLTLSRSSNLLWRQAKSVLLLTLIASCGIKIDSDDSSNLRSLSAIEFFSDDATAITLTSERVATLLSTTPAEELDADSVYALSSCQCGDLALAQLILHSLKQRGVLPTVLVPDFRSQLQSDVRLSTLRSLGAIGQLVITPAEVEAQITSGMQEKLLAKMQGFLPKGTAALTEYPNALDAFSSSLPLSQASATSRGNEFTAGDQATLWMAAFALPYLWQGTLPRSVADQAPFLLATMRSLLEMKYSFGVDVDSAGNPIGGLTIDPEAVASSIGAYDPEKSSNLPPRILTGSFTVSLSQRSTLDLIFDEKEKWTALAPAAITLQEQTRLWQAGASLFQRLRPENRNAIEKVFGTADNSLIRPDAHKLGLVVLPAMQSILSTHFTNRDQREIYQSFSPGTTQPSIEHADVHSIAAYMRALLSWYHELSDLSQSQLSPENIAKLKDAPKNLLAGIQLGALRLLSYYSTSTTPSGAAVATMIGPNGELSSDELAAAIAILAQAEQTVLKSPLIQQRVWNLFHSLIGVKLADTSTDKSLTQNGLMWMALAAHFMKDFTLTPGQLDELNKIQQIIQGGFAKAGWSE